MPFYDLVFTAGQALTAALMNKLMANDTYLKEARPFVQKHYYHGSAYTTTSNTWGDVDATNAAIAITPDSARVRIQIYTTAAITASDGGSYGGLYFSVYSVTLSSRAGDTNKGLFGLDGVDGTMRAGTIVLDHVFDGLTKGTEAIFKLQWRNTNAQTSEIRAQHSGIHIVATCI